MLNFNFTWDLGVSIEQMVGFQMAAAVWSHYIEDDIDINLHIASANTLGEDGEAVGGAVPLFHEVNYGVFKEYYEDDISSDNDQQAHGSLQEGNNVEIQFDGQVVDGNTKMLLTSAQAKALGMENPLLLDNGTTWDRDIIAPDALDGYIIINQSFDWNYDFARQDDAPENSLDFFSMALHEIGHQLGFVSGIDGTLDILNLHSGETRIEEFTVLDLFRKSINSGSVSDVTLGENAYFSIDGGQTQLAEFATGDQEEDFQASHWKRFQTAIGIMDPTLAYKERLSLTGLDLQAFDVLGYDINQSASENGLDLMALLEMAQEKVSTELDLDIANLSNSNGETDIYKLGYSGWWKLFEKQIHELGYSGWWDVFEKGYEYWQESLTNEQEILELGYSGWWQLFDEQMQNLESELLALGYSGWWQEFKDDMLSLGYSSWWQLFELGYSSWWQKLDNYFSKLETTSDTEVSIVEQILNPVGPLPTSTTNGGDKDDIIGGTHGKDLISGLKGDDLIDGKAGDDMIMGDEGDDLLYGFDGNDKIFGGEGDDFITGERDHDQLYGEEGADIVSGGSGNDLLSGGEGKDVLKGDQGTDLLIGGSEDDVLEGGEDNDSLWGESGQDIIEGGDGDDVIYGDRSSTSSDVESLQAAVGITAENDTAGVNFWLRLEAEAMDKLVNFNKTDEPSASGGQAVISGGNGRVVTQFNGATGLYDLVVSYFDSDAGQGTMSLKVGNKKIDKWTLDQDNNGFVTYLINDVELSKGDRFYLIGKTKGNEVIKIDYLDIINANEDSSYDYNTLNADSQLNLINATSELNGEGFRLEAEAMTLDNGYEVQTGVDFASGNNVITQKQGNSGTATYTFDGNSGIYDIFVSYIDGANGNKAQAQVKINGQDLNSWLFNRDTGSSEYRLLGTEVILNQGDVIEIIGSKHAQDSAQIDYLEFFSVSSQSDDRIVNDYIQKGNQVKRRIEAENMNLSGNHNIRNNDFSSGGQIAESTNKNNSLVATTTFDGAPGYYNIVLGYHDGNNGIAQFNATFNGSQNLDSWQADLNLGSSGVQRRNFVSRTLATKILLQQGDEFAIQATRSSSGNDLGFIDYVDFVPYDPTVPIRIEAEYMKASGNYELEEYNFTSSKRVIKANSRNLSDALKLKTTFTGVAGQYNIIVHYFDEDDGEAKYSASIGGVSLDSWIADRDLDENLISQQNAVAQTLTSNGDSIFNLNPGDEFELTVQSDNYEWGRVDYVEFVPYDPTAPIRVEAEYMNASGDYELEKYDFASSKRVIKADSRDLSNALKLKTTFTGEAGEYSIVVHYWDENDGEAKYSASLGGSGLDSWIADQDLGDNLVSQQNAVARTLSNTNGENFFTLNPGDEFELTVQSDNYDWGRVDYVEFIPYDPNASSTVNVPTAPTAPIQLEIENMQLSQGTIVTANFAGGGAYVATNSTINDQGNSSINNGQFTASTLFQGVEGYYDIQIGYFDTDPGEAGITFKLNEEELASWVNNQSSGSNSPSTQNLVNRTVARSVYLEKEDVLQIIGQENNGDRVNADYIKLIRVDPLRDITPTTNSFGDIIRGGAGSDRIFGDRGDDLLYGEDEYDTANSSNAGNDTLVGGTASDTLYGNSGNDLLYGDVMSELTLQESQVQDSVTLVSPQGIDDPMVITKPISPLSVGGNDYLVGNSGSDQLFAGDGHDTLNGTDMLAMGKAEQDILTGGQGADLFVLGDVNNPYYLGQGDQDFVIITDFDPLMDSLQLYGSIGEYQQSQQGNDLVLSYQNDLVAVFTNRSSLSLGSQIAPIPPQITPINPSIVYI